MEKSKQVSDQKSRPSFSKVLSISQAGRPEAIANVLLVTAIKESWINLLIYFHTAIFLGILLLAFSYPALSMLWYLGAHLVACLLACIVLVILIRQKPESIILYARRNYAALLAYDAVIGSAWGLSNLILIQATPFDQNETLIIMLMVAGVISAVLAAKFLLMLVVGRLFLFVPSFVFFIIEQTPNWLLHSGAVIVCFMIALGVGYAMHIQLIREADIAVELEQAKQAVQNEAVFREHFLKSITHDMRQPIVAMGLYLRRLSSNSDAKEIEALQECLQSANSIMDNVAQLSWAHVELPVQSIQTIKLNDLFEQVEKTESPLADELAKTLRFVKTKLVVRSQRDYLTRALSNLVHNALEHADKVLVVARKRGENIIVQVWDNGPGIQVQDQQAIFDAYVRQGEDSIDAQHMGLGLSIVRNIMRVLKGRVTLRTKPGQGSCFTLELPNHQAKETEIRRIRSVIIIDDNPTFAKAIEEVASSLGYIASSICNPVAIRSCFNDPPDADLLLIDQVLNQDFSGADLVHQLKRTHKVDTRCALISSEDNPSIRAMAQASDTPFYSKPNNDDLEIWLRQVIKYSHEFG